MFIKSLHARFKFFTPSPRVVLKLKSLENLIWLTSEEVCRTEFLAAKPAVTGTVRRPAAE